MSVLPPRTQDVDTKAVPSSALSSRQGPIRKYQILDAHRDMLHALAAQFDGLGPSVDVTLHRSGAGRFRAVTLGEGRSKYDIQSD
ncbi:hypothetical protein AURDEDRAFT_165964 [Auricularia subglabra TFB-10046 SS5]|nr:hypothetical protein AURDEDRAFT_165964 [Auricularia subglabra TFB-10046 SS5]